MANSGRSYTASEKLDIYKIARDLFNAGFSYPQVIEKLTENGCDNEIAKLIADKALPEKWDELFDIAKNSFGQGKTYSEVISLLENHEEDREIVKHIADAWYEVKTFEIENTIESPTNIFEGLKWVIISAIGISVVFLFKFSLFSKILWIIVFVGATIQ